MKSLLICYSVFALAGSAAFAADSPWNGTWKLDPSQSHFTGETFTYSKGAGQMLHFSDGSATNYDFAIDGKEYKSWANRTVSWKSSGNNAWDTVTKANGTVLAKSHRALSSDGKTLTVVYTGTSPDGTAFNDEEIYTRTGGSEGLVGSWRVVKVTTPDAPQTFLLSSPATGVLRSEIPDMKASTEGRLDGSDRSIAGPTIPPDMTIAQTLVKPSQIKYVIKVSGKLVGEGIQTLASDNRSFTDVSWNPGKESEKTTGVYVKQ